MFKKGSSPCKQEFSEIRLKRQILDHYLKGICNITNDIDVEFSKLFTEYIKNIQHQNSKRANSKILNEVFSIIYSYKSILELKKKHKMNHRLKHPDT